MSDLERGHINGAADPQGEGEVHKIVCDTTLEMLSPEREGKLSPHMEALKNAVLQLSQKHKLRVEERMILRQRLITWLESKLESFPQYPSELVKVGLAMHGERFAKEISADAITDADPKGTMKIIDDTWDDISEV